MKLHKVSLTDKAQDCLVDIAEYIALDSPARAEVFIREMLESLTKILSIFPLSGNIYEEVATQQEIRKLAYKNYVSFYRVTNNNDVEIVFISNSAQNIKDILCSLLDE